MSFFSKLFSLFSPKTKTPKPGNLGGSFGSMTSSVNTPKSSMLPIRKKRITGPIEGLHEYYE